MKLFSVCVLLLLASICAAETVCKVDSKDYCRCTAAVNGSLTLDISGYFKYPENVPEEGKDYVYEYSPCKKINCKTGGLPAHAHSQPFQPPDFYPIFHSASDTNLGVGKVCQHGTSVSHNCGSAVSAWVIKSENPLSFLITYSGGEDDRVSYVEFEHDSGDNKMVLTRQGSKQYHFGVTGQGVAPYHGSGSGGGGGGGNIAGVIGWVIIAVFIIVVVTYFVIGGLVNYYPRGARGAEVIPNYAFWKDLPFLIKDGFLFTISPCYKPALERISYQKL